MTFAEAIQSGFKNYINFDGRSSRSEYNYWTLFVMLLNILAVILDPPNYYTGSSSMLGNILALVLALPGIAVGIRRFHDINKSGWNWLWLLTIIGVFPCVYWLVFKPGDNGDNSYGSNPLIISQVSSDKSNNDNESVSNEPNGANVEDELKKLKRMLDDGLIEQNDYDAKKKDLLDL
jgi:uncharacterized membrane protein YhaH (DUF805 family)